MWSRRKISTLTKNVYWVHCILGWTRPGFMLKQGHPQALEANFWPSSPHQGFQLCPSLYPKHQESSAQTLVMEFWELFLALFLHGLSATNTKLREKKKCKSKILKTNLQYLICCESSLAGISSSATLTL